MYFNLVTGDTRYEMAEDETLAGSENITRMFIGEYNFFTEIKLRIQINVDILFSATILCASIFISMFVFIYFLYLSSPFIYFL